VDASRLAAEASLREAEERATTAALGRRRTRRLALALAVALILTLVAAGLAAQQQRRADDRAEEASRASAVADANRLAAVAGANKDLDLSLLLAAEAVRVADTPDTRDGLLSTLVEHRQVLGMHRVPVGRPQRAAVAGGGRVLVTILNMGPVLAWDLTDSGPPRDLMPDNGRDQPRDLAVSPDGELVAVTVGNGVRVRDVQGGHRLDLDGEAFGGAAWNLVFEPDGEHLLVAVAIFEDPFRPPSTMALVRVDLATGAIRPLGVRETAPGGNEIGVDLADDASAAVFSSAAPGGVATLHDLATGRRTRIRPDSGDTSPVTGFQLLPSGVAELHDGGSFMIHDLSSGRLVQRLSGHLTAVQRVRASPDGRTVVSVAGDRRVVVWDVRDGTLIQREVLTGHVGRVVDAAFSPDGKRLYTASLDGTLIGWDLSNEQRFGLPIPGVPAGRYVSNRPAAANGVWVAPTRPVPGDRPEADVAVEATFIEADSGKVLASVPVGDTVPFTSYGSSVAASPDGSQVVVTSGWRTTLLDVATRRVLGELVLPAPAGQREPEAVWGSAWSADGKRIFLAGDGRIDATPEDGRVIVVNARTMKVTARIDVGGDVQTVAVSPDGRWLAAALEDFPKVTLVDLTRSASRARELPPGPGADLTLDVAFSPDSTRVAAGGHTGTLSVWTLASRTLVREPARLHTGFLEDVNWLPDGDTVATAGTDGRAVLYDMTRGLIRGQPLPVQADGGDASGFLVPVSGDRLVVLDREGGGQLYPLRTSAWLAHACLVAGRDMTRAEWRSYVPDRPYRQTCGDLAHG
jgi:WD40 repeat protein